MLNTADNIKRTIQCGRGEEIPCGVSDLIRLVVQQGMMDEAVHGGTDIWGVTWEKVSMDHIAMVTGHPLQSFDDLDTFSWPDPEDFAVKSADLEFLNSSSRDSHFVMAHHTSGIFERAWEMVGMDQLLIEMVQDPSHVMNLCEKIGDFHVGVAKKWIDQDIDAVGISDDYGSENALMFSPEYFRTYIKPQLNRIFEVYRAANLPIMLHSCGRIEDIIDDIVELGVSILNPLQASCNDLDYIRKRTDQTIVLYGGIDNRVLMKGSEQAIRDEITSKVESLGRDGYYIAAPDQHMPFPKKSIDIFLETMDGLKSFV